MAAAAQFLLSYDGADAARHEIDFYDVAEALLGFQRSLAITTHLVLNGKVITQAPALKGAVIRAVPPRAGSWEFLAHVIVIGGAAYKLGTTPKDSPIGHLVFSAYDYIIKSLTGVHVDFDKSLGAQIAEQKKFGIELPKIGQGHLDAAAEKCEKAIADMHRPMIRNETALFARVTSVQGHTQYEVGTRLDAATFEHLAFTLRSESVSSIRGRVAGYYSASFKGRLYVQDLGRTVPFELMTQVRGNKVLRAITDSLTINTLDPGNTQDGFLSVQAFELRSRAGVLKALQIVFVST